MSEYVAEELYCRSELRKQPPSKNPKTAGTPTESILDGFLTDSIREAHDALSDAAVLREGGTDKAVVNRLYYACFHAAQAVLYAKGFEPGSPRGVISLFGQAVVLSGEASGADGRFLNELHDYREQADYDHDPIEANVDELFERTEEFVADMEALCE